MLRFLFDAAIAETNNPAAWGKGLVVITRTAGAAIGGHGATAHAILATGDSRQDGVRVLEWFVKVQWIGAATPALGAQCVGLIMALHTNIGTLLKPPSMFC